MSKLTNNNDIAEMFGDKVLRWYQIATRNQIGIELQKGMKRIAVIQPTGTGKTLTVAASMSHPEIRKGLGITDDRPIDVLFVSHKHRLLSQAEETFLADNNVNIIKQSMMSKIPEGTKFDVTIIDECHHEACASFQHHLETLGTKPVIGLTATPKRADGLLIKFEVHIDFISREEAVEQGFLSETDIKTFCDMTGKNKVSMLKQIYLEFPDEFKEMIVFFSTRKEVVEFHEFLLTNGVESSALITQSDKEVDAMLDRFSNKEVDVIINCNKINEGVDVKNCSNVFLARTIGSYPQLNQIIGRASRPDSPCTVWELADPLNPNILDTTIVVGTPKTHMLYDFDGGNLNGNEFDYQYSDISFSGTITF